MRLVFQENSYPEMRKNVFLGSKMEGRLIHGIDLYTGKYGIWFHTIVEEGHYMLCSMEEF